VIEGTHVIEGSDVFGTFSQELEAGARNAVDVCLAIQPGERVALVADESSKEVAASIAAALTRTGASSEQILIEHVAARAQARPPADVMAAPDRSDPRHQ
jgi:leucyl aminopeptidase (aminopeptidase T)